MGRKRRRRPAAAMTDEESLTKLFPRRVLNEMERIARANKKGPPPPKK